MNQLERKGNVYFYNCIWNSMTTLAYMTELVLNVTTTATTTTAENDASIGGASCFIGFLRVF
jgi:hypothetical protein